ncbi:hypothetical protein [Parasedimentitalea huanghaiensis]|uniref:Uncharacterized protein n=1 Tax=Parasedimentitalea huanghaiensis TaxID=2682100 RepID=A0A6L6WE13_9RHOB|nr:hypothetical protein [Zongyanglinia huanghaiensis]MVO14805.1 hypothetical protein [Zongyanglinia huanghaiensis]
MTQHGLADFDPTKRSGSDLQLLFEALHSNHNGSERPAYAMPGMLWAQSVSATQTDLMYFDGVVDHLVLRVNPATGLITGASAFLRDAANLNAGKVAAERLSLATKTQAEAGEHDTKLMTPLRVLEAIAALGLLRSGGKLTGSLTIENGAPLLDLKETGKGFLARTLVNNEVYLVEVRNTASEKKGNILTADLTETGALQVSLYHGPDKAAMVMPAGEALTDPLGIVTFEKGKALFAPVEESASTVFPVRVNFNGTGAVSIRSSKGVASVVKESPSGPYTVHFYDDQPDTNYGVSISAFDFDTGGDERGYIIGETKAVGSVSFFTTNLTGTSRDFDNITVLISR